MDALHRRNIDFCCAQETRWKGESARMLGANGRRYKFFWQGCNKGTAGVGVFIAERWIDSVVNVVRVNEQTMYVKLVIGKQIVNIVSAYAPQVGLWAEEIQNPFLTAQSTQIKSVISVPIKEFYHCALWNS